MKKLVLFLAAAALILSLSGCGEIVIDSAPAQAPAAKEEPTKSSPAEIGQAQATEIKLMGSSAEVTGSGVSVQGSVITVSAPGEYRVSGKLDDGRIVVNTGEDALKVTLILDCADIRCSDGPAIECLQAKKLTIELADGSANTLVSGSGSQLVKADESAQGAVIFSQDDLELCGSGQLTITAFINNGITGKDDVKLLGGSININAANNGVRGSESVLIDGAELTITAMNDGIKSSSSVKEGKGYVTVNSGSISVKAEGDGISSAAELTVNSGSLSIHSTGSELVSGKCIKSVGTLTVNGGELELSAERDKGIASDADVIINGGSISVRSGSDGISSHTAVQINAGRLGIISGGDGIKAGLKGGSVGSVAVTGGSIELSAAMDPVDAKGSFTLTGGSLIGAGNAKHVKNMFPGNIACVQLHTDTQIPAYTTAVISGPGGFSASITPERGYKLVCLISPEITAGSEYTLTAGSSNASANAS